MRSGTTLLWDVSNLETAHGYHLSRSDGSHTADWGWRPGGSAGGAW